MSRVSKDTQPGSGTAAFRGLLASTAPEAGSGCLSGKDAHPKRDQKQFGVVLPKPRPGAQPGEKATSVADATARHTLLVTPWLRTCLSAPAPCCWPQRGHRFCPRDPTVTPAAPGASSLDRASSFPDSLTSHESLDRWVWPAEPSSPASSLVAKRGKREFWVPPPPETQSTQDWKFSKHPRVIEGSVEPGTSQMSATHHAVRSRACPWPDRMKSWGERALSSIRAFGGVGGLGETRVSGH